MFIILLKNASIACHMETLAGQFFFNIYARLPFAFSMLKCVRRNFECEQVLLPL